MILCASELKKKSHVKFEHHYKYEKKNTKKPAIHLPRFCFNAVRVDSAQLKCILHVSCGHGKQKKLLTNKAPTLLVVMT